METKEEEKGEGKVDEGKVEEEKVVTLSQGQYAGLLDRIAELEDMSLRQAKQVYDVDELAQEGVGRSGPTKVEPAEGVDWESLSNLELVEKVIGLVNQAGLTLETKVETLKVLREIDKCEAKYDDFWKFEAGVRKIAAENPTLSIEKAYRLAKLEKPGEEVSEKGKGERVTKTEKLLSLPPRFPGGEKPGVVPSSTKGTAIRSLKEAADKAWEEAVGGGKIEI